MKKVLITGASGFVGENLNSYLIQRGYKTCGISLRKDNWQTSLKLEGDVLIHLAGKAHDTANISSEEEYFKVNRDLTVQLFKLFLESNVKDFLFFSSVKAIADSVMGTLYEDTPANPQTPYGKSKYEAEEFILSQKLPQGKRLFIIRPCMIHGPGNKGNLNLLYKVVKMGVPWPLGAFENQRSFLSVENLSFLVTEIIGSSGIASGIYNFSDDDSLSTNDLVDLMSGALNTKTKIWNISPVLINLLVRIGDILSLPLNSERLKKLTESYVVSNVKIKEALGVESLPISIKQGLVNTIKSFKK
ncbi:NAD-dependent epimerase/dehydratase family protein [Sphingobacterium siyangense]|uniref:NAD-dependent epimerase/dehydratase family protein n=1 Tax=Sphingobacterium siyangense TaxID=459529 RepID=UPI003DA2CA6A